MLRSYTPANIENGSSSIQLPGPPLFHFWMGEGGPGAGSNLNIENTPVTLGIRSSHQKNGLKRNALPSPGHLANVNQGPAALCARVHLTKISGSSEYKSDFCQFYNMDIHNILCSSYTEQRAGSKLILD